MSVRTTARAAAALLGAVLVLLLAAPTAGAEPYGSTTTTAPAIPEVEATCSTNVTQAKPGADVVATVGGVFFGEHVVLLFDGKQVGETTAPLAALAAAAGTSFNGGSLAALPLSTTVAIKFKVPSNASVGTHSISAVGDTFQCFCNRDGKFTVVAATAGGSLARTGVEAALVLVVGLALVIAGRGLLAGSRLRRRSALRPEHERELARTGR
jgi:hypothetical protein